MKTWREAVGRTAGRVPGADPPVAPGSLLLIAGAAMALLVLQSDGHGTFGGMAWPLGIQPVLFQAALPLVVAHRGASRSARENTRRAFDLALAQGAGGIELDVRLTADGVPVVHHDPTLARAGGGRKRVSSLSLREIRDRVFPPVPTLADVLRRYGPLTRLFVEIKSPGEGRPRDEKRRLAEKVVATVRTHLPPERMGDLFILSFDGEVLGAVRRADSRLRCVWNLTETASLAAAHRPCGEGLFAVGIPVRRLTPAFVRQARRAGLAVVTWTCNTSGQVRRALASGADVIMTDDPEWLGRHLTAPP